MRRLLIFILLTLVAPLQAQLLSQPQISARIESSQADGEDEATQVWEEALQDSKAAEAARKMERQLRDELKSLEKPVERKRPADLPPGASLAEHEALLGTLEKRLAEVEAEIKDLSDRAKQAPSLGVALTEEEETLKAQLKELEIPPAESGGLAGAQYQKALATKEKLEARLREVDARRALTKREAELFDQRLMNAKMFQADLEKQKDKLEEKIEKLKAAEAEDTRNAIARLEEQVEGVPELAKVITNVKEIRSEQAEVEEKLAEAKRYDARIEEIGRSIEREYGRAEQRINLLEDAGLGVDDETGMLLRRQRANLPSVDEISTELKSKLELVAQAEISLLNVNDRLKNLPIPAENEIAEFLKENPEVSREEVEEIIMMGRESLADLAASYRGLIEELTKGTAAAKRTILEIQNYSNFIDKRLLWIKSAKPLDWREPLEEWKRIVTLVGPESLAQVGKSIREKFFDQIVGILLVLMTVTGILLRRRKLREVMKTNSAKAARRNCTSLRPTLEYLGAAILLSLCWPVLVWQASRLVADSVTWEEGLYRLALFLFFSSLLLKFSRPKGLFDNHFRILPERSASFYRNLKWLTPVAPVFVFLVPALTSMDRDPEAGRLTFMLAMGLLAAFCHNLFQPNRSILQRERKSNGFTKACYLVIMACPAVFIIGAALGYLESVLTLRDQAAATAGLLVLAFLLIRFFTRWTLVSRRALAIKQALRRREALIAEREREREQEGEPVTEKDEHLASLEEVKAEAVDVVEVEEQTVKLLKIGVYTAVLVGLWGIWESTLPALSVLDKVELWDSGKPADEGSASTSSPSLIPGMSTGTGGEGSDAESADTRTGPVAQIMPEDDGKVSLQDLLFTILFLALTFVAAKNIPGVLSLAVFSRIKLGPGGNFALTTTVRYLIVFTGIVVALGQIGITWGKVQWLAAAVSLGIGFGLQEIFANFVAGIILLFERPIRLGDIVTVGDISGSVTQIRIRATTIRQFNNRELLVPNKEFITSQLVNWTLNDSILRLEIPVGIAYGSDTEKATAILEKILKEHPHTMEDPGPVVFFMGFGNSTLDFEARAFVPSVEFLLTTKSELHYQIDHAFREAGIEIAFPQQDIHVRSLPAEMKLTTESSS